MPTKNTIVIKLDEELPLETLIIKFYANDPDDGDNGKANFSIKKLIKYDLDEQQQQNTLPFRLLSNGDLKLVNKLDREKIDKYEMIIQCQDQAASTSTKSKSLTSEVHLIIYIQDVNDNCPQNMNSPANNTRTRFINKEQLLNPRSVTSLEKHLTLFETNYTDADLGMNSELKLELLTYQELFSLRETSIRVKQNQVIYKIQLILKTTNSSVSANKFAMNSLVKLGKYVIKLRINDKGEPSCSIIDTFILFVGNNQYRSLNELTTEIKNQRNQDEALNRFQLDDENDSLEFAIANGSKIFANYNQNKKLSEKSKFKKEHEKQLVDYTQNDYLLLIAITSIVIIVLIFFTLLCTIYFYNRFNKNSKAKVIEKDNLLTNNENDSKNAILGITQQSSNSNSEILYNADNRLSLSFKSTEDTDQSNSIDSITSSTFTKETKTSATQINSEQLNYQQQQPKTVTYSATTTFQRNQTPNSVGRQKKSSNNNMLKYSSVNGYILTTNSHNTTTDNIYKTSNSNYKSILKDNSKSKRFDNDILKRLNNSYNTSQNSSDIIDINDLDEESTSFLASRIQPSYSNSNQYDYKSSAV